MRLILITALVMSLVGCGSGPIRSNGRAPMPTIDPKVLAAGVVSTAGGQVVRRPVSSSRLVVGVPYAYDVPDCEGSDPIDFDGSFWDALEPSDAARAAGQAGVMVMMSDTTATFRSDDGIPYGFRRHLGNKAFSPCS